MIISKLYKRLHNKAPKLGEAVSLTTAIGVITSSSLIAGIPLWALGITKVITGAKVADNLVIKIAKHWISINNTLLDNILPERDWRIDIPSDLQEDRQYLLISNHLSWVDTSIVQYVSQDVLPLTRFFTKFSLIYIPIVGQAFYFLDFPMMKRPSKKKMKADFNLRAQNILEAKRACELLKNKPFALLNYLEGTRFTLEKHKTQQSPYVHLLKPRAGGISLAIQALGPQIDGILDMTIVYPDGNPTYADLWEGKVKRLGVHIRRINIPEQLFTDIEEGDYNNNGDMKQAMYAWLDEIWQQKDKQISLMLVDFENSVL